MKKLLFAILTVILLVPSAYSDELGYISMASSTSDVMNSVISAGAIINAFSGYRSCGLLPARYKNNIVELIYGSFVYTVDSEGKTVYNKSDITVQEVYEVLYVSLVKGAGPGREESDKQKEAQSCLMDIIEQHNAIVRDAERQKQELQSAEWKKGKIFTSEQEYNDTLRAKGKCEESGLYPGKGNTGIMFSSTVRTRKECEKHCRNVAIKSACYIDATFFEYDKEEKTYRCTCNTIGGDLYDSYIEGIDVKKDYFFMPTWEDYKKLYNMK